MTGGRSHPPNESLGALAEVQLHGSLGFNICFHAQYSESWSRLLLFWNVKRSSVALQHQNVYRCKDRFVSFTDVFSDCCDNIMAITRVTVIHWVNLRIINV